ncbi:hypothetical protein Bbelb_364530 [Branchiostoma belcheri]|nr:hypothetical protein Bbelb_364530 [Branchiostoma belcheri]
MTSAKLHVDDICFCEGHVALFLEKRKNDQFQEGHWICIAQTHNTTCPVSPPLPPRLHVLRSRLDSSKYGLYSLRANGASAATAMGGIPDRLIAHHGGWRSVQAREGYILESESSVLAVPRSLGLWSTPFPYLLTTSLPPILFPS